MLRAGRSFTITPQLLIDMSNKRTIVVTGSNGRLGSLIAKGFLAAGEQVVGMDRSLPAHKDWSVIQMDATNEQSVLDAFSELEAKFGPPAAVVHTVGMWAMSPLAETSLGDWEGLLKINLTSAFLVFRQAVRQMSASGGTLIGIASRQGVDRGAASQAGYSASKGGLVRLIESIAAELGETGITAHALAPSTIVYGEDGKGVRAEDLVDHCKYLVSDVGASLNGGVLSAFGTG